MSTETVKKTEETNKTKLSASDENFVEIFNKELYEKFAKSNSYAEIQDVIDKFNEKYELTDDITKTKVFLGISDVCNAIAVQNLFGGFENIPHNLKSAIGWELIQIWFFNGTFVPAKLISYMDMLNYDAEEIFTNRTMKKTVFEWLQEQASQSIKLLENMPDDKKTENHDKVIAHLQSIVDGNVPFGFKIQEEKSDEQ